MRLKSAPASFLPRLRRLAGNTPHGSAALPLSSHRLLTRAAPFETRCLILLVQ